MTTCPLGTVLDAEAHSKSLSNYVDTVSAIQSFKWNKFMFKEGIPLLITHTESNSLPKIDCLALLQINFINEISLSF